MKEVERQKLLQAIALFVRGTRNCGLVKLFKLLYYLDMLHFRETGRSVTGLSYSALPYGPVPTSLYEELRQPEADMGRVLKTESVPPQLDATRAPFTRFSILKSPGQDELTRRESRIIQELCEIFRDVSAEQISDISHARNGPWELARRESNGGAWGQTIDFFNSLNLKLGSGKPLQAEELRDRAADFELDRSVFG